MLVGHGLLSERVEIDAVALFLLGPTEMRKAIAVSLFVLGVLAGLFAATWVALPQAGFYDFTPARDGPRGGPQQL